MISYSADVRRAIASRAIGLSRLLIEVHAHLEDIEGAVGSGQRGVALCQARTVLMQSMGLRSLVLGGDVQELEDDTAFDPFEFLPSAEVRATFQLLSEGLEVVDEGMTDWVRRVRGHVDDSERRLGFGRPLHSIRRPDGLFPALRAARNYIVAVDELGLPPLFPREWLE